MSLSETTKNITPNMVDKYGTKWYLDKSGSTYASSRDNYNVTLGDATVWLIEELNGRFRMCLVIDKQVVYETTYIENGQEPFFIQKIGQEVDRLRALKGAGRRFKH